MNISILFKNRFNRILGLAVICGLALINAASCSNSQSGARSASVDRKSVVRPAQPAQSPAVNKGKEQLAVEAIDLRDAVAQMVPIERGKHVSEEIFDSMLPLRANLESSADRLIVTPRQCPNKEVNIIDSTLALITQHIVEEGVVPSCGYDICPNELRSTNAGVLASNLGPATFANRYHPLINTSTGRIYGSFDKNSWSAGGLFIEPLVRHDDGKWYTASGELYELYDNSGNTREPVQINFEGGYTYGVFGDEPGEVLYTDVCVFTGKG